MDLTDVVQRVVARHAPLGAIRPLGDAALGR
jgi:hypothetical protein